MEKWLDAPCDWRDPASRREFAVFWDRSAEFGRITPLPSPQEVAGFYDVPGYYTHGDSGAPDKPNFAGKVLTHLAWRADNGSEPTAIWWKRTLGDGPLRILEVGCGDGRNLSVLRDLGHDVVGVEPDAAARKNATAAGHHVLDGTAEALPDLQGTFDAVIFMHVLEHCIDPAAAIENARGLLREGGKLIVEVPNNECLGIRDFGNCWYFLDIPRHLNFFTGRSLSATTERAGLAVQRIEYRGFQRRFGAAWMDAQNAIASRFGRAKIGAWKYWFHLLRTAFVSDAKKYDSVRIIATLT